MSQELCRQLLYVAPETLLLGLACVLLVVDTISNDRERRVTYWFAQFSLLAVVALVLYLFPHEAARVWNGHFISDPMSAVLKAVIGIITIMVFFYSHEYWREHGPMRGEYFVLGLFAVLGMMVMASAYSLLTVYLGLELLSLSLYSIVAMHRDSTTASEAAMKYFVLGALASGMLLYGISILYGVTGAIDLGSLSTAVAEQTGARLPIVFGLVFIIVGVAFKLGAVPFHMWIPDVYEGSPTAVTMFVGSAPKIAAFAMAIRLLVDGLGPMHVDWQGMLVILSVLSMGAGNIIAISQSNIKRMLAYSTIAHIGFLLLGIIAGTDAGYAGSMFYVIVYAVMSTAAFGMVIIMGRKGYEGDRLDDFKGLAKRSPWFAFIMLIVMFSMAGVPPFIGFWAKWFVIKEVVAAGYLWLAALAVIFSVIGAYYYLRIVKLMYFDAPENMIALKASQRMRWVLSANGLAVLLLGLLPGALMLVCLRAMSL